MANEKDELPSLDSLDKRIKQIRQAAEEKHPTMTISKGQSRALRGGTEILAGVGVGAFIGYYLDDKLGTRPWLLMVLVILGFAGGVMNLYRAVANQAAAQENETNPDGEGGKAAGSVHNGENAGE